MAAKQGPIRNWLEYSAAYMAFLFFAYAPLCLAVWVARRIADAWRLLDPRHCQRIRENSMRSLGLDSAQAEQLVKDNYRHYVILLLEACRLSLVGPDEIKAQVDYNGADKLAAELMAEGKGMVFITGHLGNWEWGGTALAILGHIDGSIARPLDNPLIDEMVNRVREKNGNVIWDKFGAIRKALTALRKGRGFGVVMDQDGGRLGRMAQFFGRPASTMRMPVELAIKSGSPLLVGALLRVDGKALKFRMAYGPKLYPNPEANPREDLLRLLNEVNRCFEDIIRQAPEQWIWIHNRWKTQVTSEAEQKTES